MLRSIATKVLLAQVVLITVATLLLGLFSVHFFGQQLLRDQQEHLNLLSQAAAHHIAAKVGHHKAQVQLIAAARDVQVYSEKFQEQLLVKYFSGFKDDFPKLVYGNEQGEEEAKVIGGVQQETTPGQTVTPSFAEVMAFPNQPRLLSRVTIDPDLRTAAVHFGYARRSYFGDTFQGLIIASLPLRRLTDGIDTILREPTIHLYLVDGRGRFLYGDASKPELSDQLRIDGQPFTPQAAMFSAEGQIDSRPSHYTAAPVDGTSWWIVAIQPHADFIAPLAKLRLALAICVILILTAAVLASHRLSRGIIRPLEQLTKAAQEIAHGRLAQKILVTSEDETGKLADAFNRMSDELVTTQHRQESLLHTEAKARLMAEMANQHKDLFLTNMNHELRTPINGIMGMTQLLETTELTGEQRDYVKTMLESSTHLLAIVDRILTYSTIETGIIEVVRSPFEPRHLVAELANLYLPKFQGKGLGFTWQVSHDVPQHLTGDAEKLRLILQNLLNNAYNFTNAGAVAITVEAAGAAADSSMALRFMVSDTGIGISAEQQVRVFEHFAQADMSATRTVGGLGLGLSICHRLATLLDGSIALASQPGHGTTVTVTLPFPVPAEAPSPS